MRVPGTSYHFMLAIQITNSSINTLSPSHTFTGHAMVHQDSLWFYLDEKSGVNLDGQKKIQHHYCSIRGFFFLMEFVFFLNSSALDSR